MRIFNFSPFFQVSTQRSFRPVRDVSAHDLILEAAEVRDVRTAFSVALRCTFRFCTFLTECASLTCARTISYIKQYVIYALPQLFVVVAITTKSAVIPGDGKYLSPISYISTV